MAPRGDARVVAIVQARMTSTRLPGKVLQPIAGRPALELELERLARATQPAEVAVATSDEPADDPIEALARGRGLRVVRGPLADVLERYRLAAEQTGADAVVRLTGDCPLLDPGLVDECVELWRESEAAYVANVIEPRTYPVGMDTEVLSAAALRAAAEEALDPYDREHVTPFLRSRPDRFPQIAVRHEPSLAHIRVTLDTPEDLAYLGRLVELVPLDAGFAEIARNAPSRDAV